MYQQEPENNTTMNYSKNASLRKKDTKRRKNYTGSHTFV